MIDTAKLLELPVGTLIMEALIERGHSRNEVTVMTPAQALDEYLAWHLGDPGWGRDVRRVLAALVQASNAKTIDQVLK